VPLAAGAAPADPAQADAVVMAAHRTAKLIAANPIDRVPLRRTWILILATIGAFHKATFAVNSVGSSIDSDFPEAAQKNLRYVMCPAYRPARPLLCLCL
jgi:hypothetical protein